MKDPYWTVTIVYDFDDIDPISWKDLPRLQRPEICSVPLSIRVEHLAFRRRSGRRRAGA